MKKIGIFYSFRSVKTKQQVAKIVKYFGKANVQEVDADATTGDEMMQYDKWILAVPTWFDGELPNYWDELLPDLEDRDLKGIKAAIFGGGNQKDYPENFVDGIGLMANFLENLGAKIIGSTSTKGYSFESSKAQKGNTFVGLALDIENQAALTDERISNWVEQLKKEFYAK
ncbi:MAG: flavodoxin [Marinilabiliaceae bacterium]|nr:flavodoxin [Marinilabiliaceae bacterium]